MWKFLTQDARRAPLESADDLLRRFVGRGFNEQVDVIGLNGKIENCPSAFGCHFRADDTETVSHAADQHLFAALRYPNQVIVHLIHRVVGTLKCVSFHVDSIAHINTRHESNVRFHPSAKALGFPAPEIYNLSHETDCESEATTNRRATSVPA